MAIAYLDTNDSNLQLWQQGEAVSSPGYALSQGQSYHFGQQARAAARLQPRDINTRYWWQLNTEPLQPSLGPARHTADLVHAHLLELHQQGRQPTEIVMAVSGSTQREQLALLLGIAQQCPFDAVGLVNRSVALGSLYAGAGRRFHLEIQLHQAVLSELAESAGRVELVRTVPLPGCGMLQLQERLVEIIATAFIRQTRFDPRRKADTEQQLYDALPTALRTLASAGEANLEVKGYRTRVVAADLETAASRLFNSAQESMGVLHAADRILVDPLAGLLPGLQRELPTAEVLAVDALNQALSAHQELLVERQQALSLITALPCLQQGVKPVVTAPITPEPIPAQVLPTPASHALLGAVASPLLTSGLALGADCEISYEQQRWLLRGAAAALCQINGQAWSDSQALGLGDRITLPTGDEVLLIEVRDPG
jgi:hypothetical protein